MKCNRLFSLFILMMLMSVISFAQKVMPPSPSSNEQEVFTVVEEMPRFPGCEGVQVSESELKKCSGEKLFQYIFANLKYPEDAKKNGVQGTVIAKFVVTKTGEVSDITILRDPGYGLGDAAKQVLKSMNTMPVKWIPGRQRGKAVNVYYTLPIKFDLGMNEKSD